MKKFVRWFEMNWGWFFVNGRKQARYAAYLRKKYGKQTLPKTKIKMSKDLKKIEELKQKIIQYKIAINTQPVLSIEWIKENILNQNKDE